jgi:hypothetical protein
MREFLYIVRCILDFIIIVALALGIDWAITCVIVKLVTMCFGLQFKWSIATGIWLVVLLIKEAFNIGRKGD